MTWAGWVMVGVGAMLVYAGMTGTSLVETVADVLNNRDPKRGAATSAAPDPLTVKPGGGAGARATQTAAEPNAAAKADAAARSIPWPQVV